MSLVFCCRDPDDVSPGPEKQKKSSDTKKTEDDSVEVCHLHTALLRILNGSFLFKCCIKNYVALNP